MAKEWLEEPGAGNGLVDGKWKMEWLVGSGDGNWQQFALAAASQGGVGAIKNGCQPWGKARGGMAMTIPSWGEGRF